MSTAKKKKIKDQLEDQQQGQLINNVKFQYKYWNSSLFNESYILNDLEIKHQEVWHTDSPDFNKFLQRLINLFDDYETEEDYMNNWSETETVSNWVTEVLDALGWDNNSPGKRRPYLEETSFTEKGKTLRPDILIVDNPDEKKLVKPKKGSGDLREAVRKVIVPVEVKYWNRLKHYQDDQAIDRDRIEKKDQDELASTVSPNEQIIRYMNLLKRPWGILTDGAVWRLFHNDLSTDDSSRYYEFNLQTLFRQYITADTEADRNEIIEAAKYFYFFFSKECLSDIATIDKTFCDQILSYSKKYISGVQEDLKERFIDAMNICCNEYFKESELEVNKENLDFIRNVAESTLFNVLFTKSLESRGVLQLSDRPYYAVSLSNIIDCIGGSIHPKFQYDPNNPALTNERNLKISFKDSGKFKFNYSPDGTEIHDKIVRLTRIIHDGGSKANDFGFEIKGFKESIFDDEELKFFEDYKINNASWVKILFQLAFIDSDVKVSYKYKQIPYAYFSPRELGGIYEGFLEWKLAYTNVDLVFENRRWKEVDLKSEKYRNTFLNKTHKNSLYFSPDNKDRSDTGSFYTPDNIVKYIVKETLTPLCKGKNSDEILNLRICDPAMGSGHFLVECLNFLTKAYMESLYEESKGDLRQTPIEVKRKILDACIYGVDVNPRAVKLAKMSLWLESAHPKIKLEKLSDQLKVFDSVISFNWTEYMHKKEFKKFDAVVGNPPFVSFYSRHSSKAKKYLEHILQEERGNYEFFKFIKSKKPRLNLSMFFFELSKNLVKSSGRVGLIGDIGFEENVYKPIKLLLSRDTTLIKYHSKMNLFSDVNSLQVITLWENSVPSDMYDLLLLSGNDLDTSSLERVVKGNSYFVANKKNTVSFNYEFLGDLFSISTGVNIGGASKKFLTEERGPNTLPFYTPSDFDIQRIKRTCDISSFIKFDQKLVEKINANNKKSGSSNTVVLGKIDRFMRKKLFVKQSCNILTSNILLRPGSCNYSVFVINAKNKKDDKKLNYLHVLLSTPFYNSLCWSSGIIKGGGGKQPQIRKGSIKNEKPGLVTIPIPIDYFNYAEKHLSSLELSEAIKKANLYFEKLAITNAELNAA